MSAIKDSKFFTVLIKQVSNMREGKNTIPVSMTEHFENVEHTIVQISNF